MRAIVVGGGIGGLAAGLFLHRAGHDVTILEQARAFGAVGAGIQLSPNATRLLRRIGVLDDLDQVSVRPQQSNQRRWSDGSVLSNAPMGSELEERFGAPYLHVYRPDLIKVLADHAIERLGRDRIRVDSSVTGVDVEAGVVRLHDGEQLEADLIVGSDGIHSVVRSAVLGHTSSAQFSGHIAYRAVLANVDASRPGGKLVDAADVNIWLGPGAHVVQYLLHKQELVNLVIVQESNEAIPESWHEAGDANVMRSRFVDWDAEVVRLLDKVESPMRWALHDHQPLDHWARGRACLLGDAAHPMLPYLAQGGAQSIEDAAALATVLQSSATTLADDLHAYELRRIPRTAAIQLTAQATGRHNHLPDGPDQIARDARLGEARMRPVSRLDVFGHDAEAPFVADSLSQGVR
jgi:salicylate hydroxylase